MLKGYFNFSGFIVSIAIISLYSMRYHITQALSQLDPPISLCA